MTLEESQMTLEESQFTVYTGRVKNWTILSIDSLKNGWW